MKSLANRAVLLLISGLVLSAGASTGSTLIVPDQYSTIQFAIDATQYGDSVLVRSGTYYENIDFSHRTIAVLSESGPGVTIIDGSQPADPCRSMTVLVSGLIGARLQGFTITGGSGWGGEDCTGPDDQRDGGGIFVRSASSSAGGVVIEDNWIANNTLTHRGDGGGLYIQGTATLLGNRIYGNDAQDGLSGGGICARPLGARMVVINGNEIFDNSVNYLDPYNSAFGGGVEIMGSVDLLDNVIACNRADWGGGVMGTAFAAGQARIDGNTIVTNLTHTPGYGAAGVRLGMGSFPLPSFTRNSVFSNIGAGIDCAGQVVTFSCNNINGNFPDFGSGDSCEELMGSDGNFSEYPMFGVATCLPGPTNWCLLEGSPQLPLHSPPDCGLIGARGECPPIGVPEAEEVSPRRFHARAARPNPFAERTTIPFYLPEATVVRIDVYDVMGRKLRTVSASWMYQGDQVVEWDGRDDRGRRVASGAYVARIQAGGRELTRNLLLVH